MLAALFCPKAPEDPNVNWLKTVPGHGDSVQGRRYMPHPILSLLAEGRCHMLFTEETDKLHEDFANPGVFDVAAGLTYHFSLVGN